MGSGQRQRKLESYSRLSARRTLGYVQAVRATLRAKIDSAMKEINETEEELGCLRIRKVMMEVQMSEADDQIAMVREMLNKDGIPEIPLSDHEDDDQLSDFRQYPPPSFLSQSIADRQSRSSDSYDDEDKPLSKRQEVIRDLKRKAQKP